MFKIISINSIIGILYFFIMLILFKTGYVNAKGLTYSNLKFLLIFPLLLITTTFNSFFIFKYKNKDRIIQYTFQVLSLVVLILMVTQFICAPIIFIIMSTGGQIFLHIIDILLMILLIIIYFYNEKGKIKVKGSVTI